MGSASVPHRGTEISPVEPGQSGSAPGWRFGISSRLVARIRAYLEFAGIQVNGQAPWDIRIRDDRFFSRVLRDGSLGLGESYVEGWWDADSLDEFLFRLHKAQLYKYFQPRELIWLRLTDLVLNRQSRRRATAVARQHYCIGNEVFEAMLDPTMQYTCAYWKDAKDLAEAQQRKLELIARKLYLQPGMRILELGGGFGGLAQYLASRHACEVVSYNVSYDQVLYARELCRGLPVRIVEADYRDAVREPGQFDRVVSIGLCEHVGHKNYGKFFRLMHDALSDGGLCLVHTIGINLSCWSTDPWIEKYIFPNGMMPSIAQLGRAAEENWVVEDWHNFGPDYDRTLMAWWANFDHAWPHLRERRTESFHRMWKYYLMASAAAFRARACQLWQIVMSKGDIPSYASVR